MGKTIDRISERVQELRSMIAKRRGQMTTEQRLELLNEMYDCSLVRAVECAVNGEAKFSTTAVTLMNSAREEIFALNTESDNTVSGVEIGFDPLVKATSPDVHAEA